MVYKGLAMSFASMVIYLMGFGQGWFIFAFFVFIFGYLAWKISMTALTKGPERIRTLKELLGASSVILAFLTVSMFLIGFLTHAVSKVASIEAINTNNALLLGADRFIFSVPGPFWFQMDSNPLRRFFDFLAPVFISSYLSLSLAICFILFVVLIKSGRVTARVVFAFLLCPLISIPFWFAFPATSPLIAYQVPSAYREVSDDISVELEDYQPNQYLERFFDYRVSQNAAGPITTVPSMHIAWVTVIVYYLVLAWKRMIIPGVIYVALVNIGAVFTLQHYFVDLLAGTLVAIFAIGIVRYIPVERVSAVMVVERHLREDARKVLYFLSRHNRVRRKKS